MTFFVALAALIGGLAILTKGADWLVTGGSAIARQLGISELAIGLTIVSFGTSLPELTVNIFSSLSGANDIAIGNILGSNIVNILLILGISAIIAPLKIQTSTVWKEIPLCLLASVLLWIMANDQLVDGMAFSQLTRSDGLALISFFIIFLWYIFGMHKVDIDENDENVMPMWLASGYVIVSVIALVAGGKLAVTGATTIAQSLGISEALIGLTVVAVGTSLPEMATSIIAARRGKADIAVGNIVGSNIFNIFWILGVSAVIHPLTFNPELNVDLIVVILATLLLFYAVHTGGIHRRFLFWKQSKGHVIHRFEGFALVCSYVAYVCFIVWRG